VNGTRDPGQRPDPRTEDIMAGDRRISRPDASLPDWEVPDTAYRPIPIVWFTGALILQLVVLAVLAVMFGGSLYQAAIGLGGAATGVIGSWTWARGMKDAGTGWKVATFLMLLSSLAFFTLAMAGAG
jgi:hypothetical protein